MKLNTELNQALLHALKVPAIRYEDSMETVDVWDSMMHMEVMLAVESRFGIRIEPDEIVELTSVAALQSYLEKRSRL